MWHSVDVVLRCQHLEGSCSTRMKRLNELLMSPACELPRTKGMRAQHWDTEMRKDDCWHASAANTCLFGGSKQEGKEI